jgi:hypothetical protein
MADFVQSADVKSAVRKLEEPIADVAAFNTLVQSVITSNPFGCVAYMTAGQSLPPVEKTKEGYTARIVYTDADAKTVGTGSERFDSIAHFNAGITAILADAALATAHGGSVSRDFAKETYAATVRCHDPNGELFTVNFSRDQVTLTSYEDDGIRVKVEAWADSVPALA